jgi:hypothetical protein
MSVCAGAGDPRPNLIVDNCVYSGCRIPIVSFLHEIKRRMKIIKFSYMTANNKDWNITAIEDKVINAKTN